MELRWYRALAVLFIVLVSAIGLASLRPLLAALGGTAGDRRLAMVGSLQRTLESRYDDAFPGRRLSVNLWAAGELALFGNGKPGVVIGRDGWLYTDEEFTAANAADANFATNIAFIRDVRSRLDEAGIPLLVTLVPAKAELYAEHLGTRRPARIQQGLGLRTLAALTAAGVTTVDLTPPLKAGTAQGPIFFRTDTHWTPLGARLAADAVVAALEARGLAGEATRTGDFRMVEAGQQAHHGDLLNFLPLDPWFSAMLPADDTVALEKAEAPAADGDLFGDAGSPAVALVGSSYSANPLWNFRGWLEAGLDEPVANYAKEAVGPFPPMARYLRSEDFRNRKPRVVIWELPLRAMLSAPDAKLMQAPVTEPAADLAVRP